MMKIFGPDSLLKAVSARMSLIFGALRTRFRSLLNAISPKIGGYSDVIGIITGLATIFAASWQFYEYITPMELFLSNRNDIEIKAISLIKENRYADLYDLMDKLYKRGEYKDIAIYYLAVSGTRRIPPADPYINISSILREKEFLSSPYYSGSIRFVVNYYISTSTEKSHSVTDSKVKRVLRDVEDLGSLSPSYYASLLQWKQWSKDNRLTYDDVALIISRMKNDFPNFDEESGTLKSFTNQRRILISLEAVFSPQVFYAYYVAGLGIACANYERMSNDLLLTAKFYAKQVKKMDKIPGFLDQNFLGNASVTMKNYSSEVSAVHKCVDKYSLAS